MPKDYANIIAKNLKRIAYERHKTQADIVKDLHFDQSTVSTWMNGTRVPRMKKIDKLCEYLNCTRADLMEEDTTDRETQTSDEEKLLRLFRSLSYEGKSSVLSYIAVMSNMPEYAKKDGSLEAG